MRDVTTLILTVILSATAADAAAPPSPMLQLTVDGRQIEGTPIATDPRRVYLLERDGRLWEFPPSKAQHYRKTSDRFRPYPPSHIRATLLRELGREFEVTGTSHYMVAHQRGQRDKWARRFEELYRSFVHYFSARGFRSTRPPFPLIGIVFRNQGDFDRYAAGQGLAVPFGVVGSYVLQSNRILLYDQGDNEDSPPWQGSASVIIHEVTHQTAFNTGIHSRYSPPPLWVAEGLATMFEAPGVYDSGLHPTRTQRINRGQLEAFRRVVAPKHTPEMLASMIASDRLFQVNPSAAYAESWALSFYLVETQRQNYMQYLRLTAERPPFSRPTPAERTAGFTAIFGNDWTMLEANMLRFVDGLP